MPENVSVSLTTLDVPIATGRRLAPFLVVCAIVVGLVAAQLVVLPGQTRLWTEFKNAGHIPLYGVVSLAVLWLSTEFTGTSRDRYFHYVIAIAAVIIIGAGTELLQILLSRDADLVDFVRNVVGGVAFLAIFSTRDARLARDWKRLGECAKRVTVGTAAILLLAASAQVLDRSAAYVHRAYDLPLLLSFGSHWSRLFLEVKDATLEVTEAPSRWYPTASGKVGRLTLRKGAYPGLWVNEPYPDWSGRRFLRFGIYSETTEPVRLTLRIHDFLHSNEYRDRFNTSLRVLPGANSFRIALDSIRTGPAQRELDIRNVAAIGLFAANPAHAYTVYINGFWLE